MSAPLSVNQAQASLVLDPAVAQASAQAYLPLNSIILTPLASTSAVPNPSLGLDHGSAPVLPDHTCPPRSARLAASPPANSVALAPSMLSTIIGSSTTALSPSFADTSHNINLAALLTPDVLLQLQWLAHFLRTHAAEYCPCTSSSFRSFSPATTQH